jgi:hypothetical protein
MREGHFKLSLLTVNANGEGNGKIDCVSWQRKRCVYANDRDENDNDGYNNFQSRRSHKSVLLS